MIDPTLGGVDLHGLAWCFFVKVENSDKSSIEINSGLFRNLYRRAFIRYGETAGLRAAGKHEKQERRRIKQNSHDPMFTPVRFKKVSQRFFSLKQAVDQAAATLDAAGIEESRREARRLLCAVLACDFAELLTRDLLLHSEMTRFRKKVERRAAREPFAFIAERADFWTLRFEVTPDTLIPRADSESLIELLLTLYPDRDRPLRIMDLGTGTGCLLLSALSEFHQAFGVGVDRSEGAVRLAIRNAEVLGFRGRASFFVGDWAQSVTRKFDIVLTNPPYIRQRDIKTLMPEVRLHEPARALDGGPDGLHAYRTIFSHIGACLSVGGTVIVELGVGQEREVRMLALEQGLVCSGQRSDLGQIVRALAFRSRN